MALSDLLLRTLNKFLQCNVKNKNLPLLYCFMKTKNKYSYNKLFEWLSKVIKEEVIKEKNIILDFERASMNALKKFFYKF